VRLFVSVQPPDEVLDGLAALDRPEATGLRWARRDQWHVTLRFLGEVTDPGPVADALARAALPPADAVVGPSATTLGRRSLVLPVNGLDRLAAGVASATAGVGEPPGPGPFRGHLTLARARGRRKVPGGLAARVPAFEARFPVADVRLVRSNLGAGGPRYEDLAVVPLG
jgi:2'-5' RNA ligase